jgi:hypothetical protein
MLIECYQWSVRTTERRLSVLVVLRQTSSSGSACQVARIWPGSRNMMLAGLSMLCSRDLRRRCSRRPGFEETGCKEAAQSIWKSSTLARSVNIKWSCRRCVHIHVCEHLAQFLFGDGSSCLTSLRVRDDQHARSITRDVSDANDNDHLVSGIYRWPGSNQSHLEWPIQIPSLLWICVASSITYIITISD